MSKIFVVGHFSSDRLDYGGQTIKTKNVLKGLINHFTEKKVVSFDYSQISIFSFMIIFKFLYFIIFSSYLLILPGKNALNFYLKFFFFFKFFSYKTHLITIGGWLPNHIQYNQGFVNKLIKTSKIYLETNSIYNSMVTLGFNNVCVMPNFKYLEPIKYLSKKRNFKSLKFCTFSRVTKEKGILNAINIVLEANSVFKINIKLDIYGQISNIFKEEFFSFLSKSKDIVKYKGIVEPNDSVNTLKKYDGLLFPTKYEGEGFPGTILDAFASGLPVIATDFKYNAELIENFFNGFLFKSDKEAIEIINWISLNRGKYEIIKENAINTYKKYSPENALKILIQNIK